MRSMDGWMKRGWMKRNLHGFRDEKHGWTIEPPRWMKRKLLEFRDGWMDEKHLDVT